MNCSSLIPVLCTAWLLAQASPSLHAQESAPAKPLKLAEVPDRLNAIDAELTQKADEVRTTVEREAAANRVPETIAQSLRWSLRTTATNSGLVDVRGVLATARVPVENEALTKAFKDLETVHVATQKARATLISASIEEVKAQTIAALSTATKNSDLQELLKGIEAVQGSLQRTTMLQARETNTLNAASSIVTALEKALRSRNPGDTWSYENAVSSLARDSVFYQDSGLSDAATAAARRLAQPYFEKVKNLRSRLDEAIVTGKSRDESTALLKELEAAVKQAETLRVSASEIPSDSQIYFHYRKVMEALDSDANDSLNVVQSRMQTARESIRQLDGKIADKLEATLKKKEQELVEEASRTTVEAVQKLRTRLADVKDATELETIASEITAASVAARARQDGSQENLSQIASTLTSLTNAWRTASPALLQQERHGEIRLAGGSLQAELQIIRERIERDTLSRSLRIPELLKPPLSEQKPDIALESFADQLAAQSDWRRLYRILEARAALRGYNGGSSPDDTLPSIRAFISGQNLELAEQWMDARMAYKEVLRATSERAPVKAAAERLKVLDREHPLPAGAPAERSFPPGFESRRP